MTLLGVAIFKIDKINRIDDIGQIGQSVKIGPSGPLPIGQFVHNSQSASIF